MMNRGLGEMFYGRRPVQYMQTGGLSGWGTMAEANKAAAATRSTSTSAQTTREPASTRTTTAATPARGAAQVTREPVAFDFGNDDDDTPNLAREIERSRVAEQLANAALGRVTPGGIAPNEAAIRSAIQGATGSAVMSRPDGGFAGGSLPAAPPVSSGRGTIQATAPAPAPVSTAGLSRPAYGDVSPAYVSPVRSRPDITSLMGNVPTAGLSRPEYGDVYGYMPPAVQTGVQTSVAPPAQPEQGGFFDGLGRFFGGMADDIAMGWTLLTQGEEGFIEKYGADALADYWRRSAETMARNEAEAAARDRDEDVFEACPEGFERDPVTQMCVPVAVKTEEEKPEEETKPEPTPSSAETLQDVINRITVGGGGTQPIVAGGGGQNVLPNVDFFRPQFGPRRMQEGGAVDYRAAARAAAEQFGVRPDLYERLILRESNFDPMARSPKGALGLAQVMPATARDPGFGVTPLANPMDPIESLRFGAEYLSALKREFGGDERKAVAAYNAGVGRVRKAGGVPDIQETQDYVDFILKGRGPVTAPPPRPANLAQKGGVRQADVARAVEALTPARRAPVEAPPMRPRPTMTSAERMSQLQGGMSGDSLSRAVDSVLSSLMR